MADCKTCERRFKYRRQNGWCQAFKHKPGRCWAWTDDPDWLAKVNEAVEYFRGK